MPSSWAAFIGLMPDVLAVFPPAERPSPSLRRLEPPLHASLGWTPLFYSSCDSWTNSFFFHTTTIGPFLFLPVPRSLGGWPFFFSAGLEAFSGGLVLIPHGEGSFSGCLATASFFAPSIGAAALLSKCGALF